MERKGYEEGYDKNDVERENKPEVKQQRAQKKLEIQRSLKERIKKFPMNLVEFLVGVALLVLCWSYIQSHPAEKSSLFSGVEAIVEKVQVKIVEWRTGRGAELQNKLKMVDEFDKLLNEAQATGDCITQEVKNQIKRARERLEGMSAEEFMEQRKAFETVINLYYSKIQEECLSE